MVENNTSNSPKPPNSKPDPLLQHLRLRHIPNEQPPIPTTMANLHEQPPRSKTRFHKRPPKHRQHHLPPHPSMVCQPVRSQTHNPNRIHLHRRRRGTASRSPKPQYIHLLPSSDRYRQRLVPVRRHPRHGNSVPVTSLARHSHLHVPVLCRVLAVSVDFLRDAECAE